MLKYRDYLGKTIHKMVIDICRSRKSKYPRSNSVACIRHAGMSVRNNLRDTNNQTHLACKFHRYDKRDYKYYHRLSELFYLDPMIYPGSKAFDVRCVYGFDSTLHQWSLYFLRNYSRRLLRVEVLSVYKSQYIYLEDMCAAPWFPIFLLWNCG